MKFAQLSSFFYGMSESYENWANTWQFLQVIYQNLSGFYRIWFEIMRFYEVAWDFTRLYKIFMKAYDISWN